jgi:hypothetical protein
MVATPSFTHLSISDQRLRNCSPESVSAGTYLSNRCLAVGRYVTLLLLLLLLLLLALQLLTQHVNNKELN